MIRYKTMSQNPHLDLAGLVAILRADAGQLYRLKHYDDPDLARRLMTELKRRFSDLEVTVTSSGMLEARAIKAATQAQIAKAAFRRMADIVLGSSMMRDDFDLVK